MAFSVFLTVLCFAISLPAGRFIIVQLVEPIRHDLVKAVCLAFFRALFYSPALVIEGIKVPELAANPIQAMSDGALDIFPGIFAFTFAGSPSLATAMSVPAVVFLASLVYSFFSQFPRPADLGVD